MTTESGLQRRVAVKLLHGSVDDSAVRRLRDEARLLAALNHRAILQVHDLVQIDARTALVTEYIEGDDLSSLLQAPGALPHRCAVEVAGEVAGALNSALTSLAPGSSAPLSLVHRDIKPGNIRIARTGAVKLLDFGIAVSSALPREAKTGTGSIIGTLGFLAPERVTDEGVRPPSDVYALGCVLFEALTTTSFLGQMSQQQMLRQSMVAAKHTDFVAKQLGTLPQALPAEVRNLLSRMLAFDETDRPTAAEVERECDELTGRLDGPHLRRWARDRIWPEIVFVAGSLEGPRGLDPDAPPGSTPADTMDISALVRLSPPDLGPAAPHTLVPGKTQPSLRRPPKAPWVAALLTGVGLLVAIGLALWQAQDQDPTPPVEVAATPEPPGPAAPPPIDTPPNAVAQEAPPVATSPSPIPATEPAGGKSATRLPAPPRNAPTPVKPASHLKISPPVPTTAVDGPALPVAATSFRLGVRGDAASVTATRDGATVTLPASLDLGVWRVRATFTSGEFWSADVDVLRAGDMDCISARARCTLR